MSCGQVDHYVGTFQASAAIAQYLRVKLTAGKLAVAGIGEVSLGTMEAPALEADQKYGVRFWNAPGSRFMVAAGAFDQFAIVYGAADGKIDDTVNGHCYGIALEAATADGDILAVLPMPTILALASAAHIADASVAHDLNASFSDTEAEAALNALGTKINSILAVLENAGLVQTS